MKSGQKRAKRKPRPTASLSPDELALVSSLLDRMDSAEPSRFIETVPSPKIAQALIERLPAHCKETIPALLELERAFSEKAVRKAVKRALFRFRKAGAAVSLPSTGP